MLHADDRFLELQTLNATTFQFMTGYLKLLLGTEKVHCSRNRGKDLGKVYFMRHFKTCPDEAHMSSCHPFDLVM